jgi:two-component system KDP operon response regulator KdpE
VIVLSARDNEDEKVAALDLGANDYVEKPFGVGELLARVRVLLRKSCTSIADDGTLSFGPLQIDKAAHRVLKSGQAIKLTPKEFELLSLLAAHPGRVLTHRQILTKVWGPAHVEDVAYLRVFIGQLRQKIEDSPGDPQLIRTEPGVGYRASIDEH